MTPSVARTGRRIGLGFGLVPLLLLLAAPARGEQSVELELVLAVDTSVSIDAREYALQTAGLAHAFRHPDVLAAIRSAGDRGIAVTLVQWGVGLQQAVAVPWRHIRDHTGAEAFARAIEESPRQFFGEGTSVSRALAYSATQFEVNGFGGRRRIIDIVSDGRNNSGGPPALVRDRLVRQGITVNALAILDRDLTLGLYYAANVVGGTAAFVETADSFDDFADAIRRKLLREIRAPLAVLPNSPVRRALTRWPPPPSAPRARAGPPGGA